MDDETHVGLVDTHAEGDGGNDDVDLFHEELVLILGTRLGVEASMVRQSFYSVDNQQFRKVLHTLTGKAVDDATFAAILLDELDYLFVQHQHLGGFGTHLVV